MVSRGGELWVRSPYLFERYDGPDGPLRRDVDGFVTVGDRGHVRDGKVAVTGRGDDTVVTAGATVLVSDVEAALSDVAEVRVVGVPHVDLGQVLVGVVGDADAVPLLRAAAEERLPPSHRPRRWQVLVDLPLTAAGKVDRARLADSVDLP